MAGLKMVKQYDELEKEALRLDPETTNWHIMPKNHLCQHLCEMRVPVKVFWTYKDETMGGTLAYFFRRRGGKDNPSHNASEVLDMEMLNCFPYSATRRMKAACTCHMLACSLPGKGTEIMKQLVLQLPQCGLLGKGKETIQFLEYGLPGEGTKKKTA